MHATRTSQTLFNIPTLSARGAMLVRIYPQQGIGEPFVLRDGPTLIGRDACAVTLPDDSISRRHAMIECVEGNHVLSDLRSTNGTYVNECRITETILQEGDRIRFGKQIFKYLTSDCIESQYHEVVYRIMTTDGLTQVYNKQYFLESLNRELEHSQRSGDPVSVLLLDLDHFKSINDQHGHLAGDTVLAEFARRARAVVRGGEVFARYGGEEFAMLCTRCHESDAIMAAERIRKSVTWAPFNLRIEQFRSP